MEQFNAVKDEFLKLKPNAAYQARFQKIQAVLEHRNKIEQELKDVDPHEPYYKRNELIVRLEKFKPATFFVDAAQAVLDDLKKERTATEAAKAAKAEQQRSRYYYGR